MNIMELGAIGELVSGVAVIGSLLLITDLLPWYRWTEGSGQLWGRRVANA